MRKITCTIVLLSFFAFPPVSSAAGPGAEKLPIANLALGDDLYIAGANVVVTEPVSDDLLAAGGSLVINTPIGSDLQAAGGSVVINGAVGDDLRAAGGDITLASNVGGDVVIYGGSVTIPAGVIVEGDAIVGAGTLNLGGTIHGNLRVDAETVVFSGTVLGDASFFGRDLIDMNGRVGGKTVFTARESTLGPDAGFGGDVSYWRKDGEMDFRQAPVAGNVLFSPELERQEMKGHGHRREMGSGRGIAAVFSALFLVTLLSGILSIAIGIILFKRNVREAGEVLHLAFWKGFGIGILTYILLPIAAVIAIFTLIGIPVGLLLLALFVFSLILGRVITAMVLAAWMERRRAARWSSGRLMLAAMGFFTVLKLVSLVPVLGWVVVVLTTMAGYGALVAALMENRRPAY